MFQALLAAAIIAGVQRVWDRDLGPLQPAPKHWGARLAVAVALVLILGGPYYLLSWLSVEWTDGALRRPEFYWVHLALPAVIGLVITTARGGWSARAFLQAVFAGIFTGAIWVPVGRMMELDHYLRMHPRALQAMGYVALVFVVIHAARHATTHIWHRAFMFVFVQAMCVSVYWHSASAGSPATLGYLWSQTESASPDGRIALRMEDANTTVEGATAGTVIHAVDTKTGQELRLGKVYAPFAGLTFSWRDDGVHAGWYEPSSAHHQDCSGGRRNFFWDSQQRSRHFPICMESEQPLLCKLAGARVLGQACEANVDCASRRCVGGICIRSAPGEHCARDEDCQQGTCLARVCRVDTEGMCDSDRDCDGYCVRPATELLGRCYSGQVGEPCTGEWGQCQKSRCLRQPNDTRLRCFEGYLPGEIVF